MRYTDITIYDIDNGPGFRISIWFQGCSHHCPGCHNPETWSLAGGELFTNFEKDVIFEKLAEDKIDGITITGGDPFDQNREELIKFLKEIKQRFPNKTIWAWTGYKFEDLYSFTWYKRWFTNQKELIENIDVLIDGKFEQDKRDITIAWRGSSNQRVIDVKRSLKENKIVLYETGQNC